jgi:hypothetical protein
MFRKVCSHENWFWLGVKIEWCRCIWMRGAVNAVNNELFSLPNLFSTKGKSKTTFYIF